MNTLKQVDDVDMWKAIKEWNSIRTPIPASVIEWAINYPDKIIHIANVTKTRHIEAEPSIIDAVVAGSISIQMVCSYCNQVLNGRWVELEDALLNGSLPDNKRQDMLVVYTMYVCSGRWRDCEKFITNPKNIWDYARLVVRGRWPEKEKDILKDPDSIYNYCLYSGGFRWEEGEKVLLESSYANKERIILNYARDVIRQRWKEAEEFLKKDPSTAYEYALNVIGGRWEEAEPIIAKNSRCSFDYAQNVLSGAFPLGEKEILSSPYYFDYFSFATSATRELVYKLANQFDPDMTVKDILQKVNDGRNKDFEEKLLNSTHNQKKAVWYATNILKCRWPEAEGVIKKSSKCSVLYARDVIKGRWEDAEKTIAKDPKYLAQYGVEVIKSQLPATLHNNLMVEKLKGSTDRMVDKYFEMLSEND